MEKIKVLGINRINSSVEFQVRFTLEIPDTLVGVQNKLNIAKSYDSKYGIIEVGEVELFTFTNVFAFSQNDSLALIKDTLLANYNGTKAKLDNFELKEYDVLLNTHYDGEAWL